MSDAPIIPAGVAGLPPTHRRTGKAAQAASASGQVARRAPAAGRFGVLNAFLDMTAGQLSRSELVTWLLLYRDTKRDGTARTSQADIARRANADSRTVRRALSRLEARGLVRIVWQGGFRKGPSVYAVAALATAVGEGTAQCEP